MIDYPIIRRADTLTSDVQLEICVFIFLIVFFYKSMFIFEINITELTKRFNMSNIQIDFKN